MAMSMEDATKKRSYDPSDAGLVSGSVTSDNMSLVEVKRPRFDDPKEYYSSSPESRQSEETILDIQANEPEMDSSVHDLDAAIKSFQKEILVAAPAHDQPTDIGYLKRASDDDELGLLPPTLGYNEVGGAGNYNWSYDMDGFDIGMIFGFEDEFFGCGYDGLAAGYGYRDGEFLAVDGLFDCAVAVAGSEWADL